MIGHFTLLTELHVIYPSEQTMYYAFHSLVAEILIRGAGFIHACGSGSLCSRLKLRAENPMECQTGDLHKLLYRYSWVGKKPPCFGVIFSDNIVIRFWREKERERRR